MNGAQPLIKTRFISITPVTIKPAEPEAAAAAVAGGASAQEAVGGAGSGLKRGDGQGDEPGSPGDVPAGKRARVEEEEGVVQGKVGVVWFSGGVCRGVGCGAQMLALVRLGIPCIRYVLSLGAGPPGDQW